MLSQRDPQQWLGRETRAHQVLQVAITALVATATMTTDVTETAATVGDGTVTARGPGVQTIGIEIEIEIVVEGIATTGAETDR